MPSCLLVPHFSPERNAKGSPLSTTIAGKFLATSPGDLPLTGNKKPSVPINKPGRDLDMQTHVWGVQPSNRHSLSNRHLQGIKRLFTFTEATSGKEAKVCSINSGVPVKRRRISLNTRFLDHTLTR